MKTIKFYTTLLFLLVAPLCLIGQARLSHENQQKLRAKMMKLGLISSNASTSGQLAYYFKPDSIKFYFSTDESNPDITELVGIMSLTWKNSNVKTLKINYIDPGIPDEDYIYTSESYVTKIEEVNTNNFYTFSYTDGKLTASSYYSDGVRISGDSLSYEYFITYYRHYKYDNGWKPYEIYSDVNFYGSELKGYIVEIYDGSGDKETYKYENTSFTNGESKQFFKPLTSPFILDKYTLENNVFLEKPSDNILGIPIRYRKSKLNKGTGNFELIEKSYATQVAGDWNIQRYAYEGNDSTLFFNGTLDINTSQKIGSYTFQDSLGVKYSSDYTYNNDDYLIKELSKKQNKIQSIQEYKYTPDGAGGLAQYEYTFRDGEGKGNTEILEFAYTDPLNIAKINFEKFEVFPNPVGNEVNFNIKDNNGVSKATIIDVIGRLVQIEGINLCEGKGVLNIASLPPGSYTILIQTNGGLFRSRFIKM